MRIKRCTSKGKPLLNYLSTIRLFVMCALIFVAALPFWNIEEVHAQYPHFYAGYKLFSYEEYAGEGVTGTIYTINPYLGYQCDLYESVAVVFSYYYMWGLIFGYGKGHPTDFYVPKYFLSKADSWGYGLIPSSNGPSPGSSHTYYITHPYGYEQSDDPTLWEFYVDYTQLFFIHTYGIYEAKDEQAYVETIGWTPDISGSHFSGLKQLVEYRQYWRWRLWSTHQKYESYPYVVTEVSNFEFYANGGG